MNRLGLEKSPYLLQHKDNPIHWHAWGEEAFQKARTENKPLFVSIGYSTCYWCHVMEKDSFEREDVAEILNKYFVSIKVDREERPDVDAIYMNAVVAISGHGGWPLNVFLTPDGKPFFGGTYFPREQFISLLNQIQKVWQENAQVVFDSSQKIFSAINEKKQENAGAVISNDALQAALDQFSEHFDSRDGGFGSAPKFPPSASISLLLRLYKNSNKNEALHMAELTLEKMACGGVYDQLGGGFHRYSTDSKWLVPHFEKMLYDNAQLAWAYLEAYQLTKNNMFAQIARETLDYVLRDMSSQNGGFFSAEDAGEVGREGEFYVWLQEELERSLSAEEFEAACRVFNVTVNGNFEQNSNIFHVAEISNWEEKNSPLVKTACEKLLSLRNKRACPHRDEKIITAWNGLTISALAKAHQILNDQKYYQAALTTADFIYAKLFSEPDGALLRRYSQEDARYAAYLDDYAFLIQGLLNLYECDFSLKWLNWALRLQQTLDNLFWDKDEGAYYFSSGKDKTLISRKKEFFDGAEPAGNSVAAANLLRFYHYTADRKYQEKAAAIFSAIAENALRYPSGFSAALMALDYKLNGAKQIVIAGDLTSEEAKKFLKAVRENFVPNKIVAHASQNMNSNGTPLLLKQKPLLNNKTTFYVCKDGSCELPTNDATEALKLLITTVAN